MLMLNARLLPKKYVCLNWEHILMMVTIMLQFLLKVKRLNFIRHFIPTWITGLQYVVKINFRMLNSRYSMQIRMFFIQIRMHNYAKTWDFKLQSSQQLKLVVKVTSFNKSGETPASGCVAIMFGFKVKK